MEKALLEHQIDQDICGKSNYSSPVDNCDSDSQFLLTQNVTSNIELDINTGNETILFEQPSNKTDENMEDNTAVVIKSPCISNDETSSNSVDFSDVIQGKRKRSKVFLVSDDEDNQNGMLKTCKNGTGVVQLFTALLFLLFYKFFQKLGPSPLKENRKICSTDSSHWVINLA